jgi:hypothetical protein
VVGFSHFTAAFGEGLAAVPVGGPVGMKTLTVNFSLPMNKNENVWISQKNYYIEKSSGSCEMPSLT